MKYKRAYQIALPTMALSFLVGTAAFAHWPANISPEDIASKHEAMFAQQADMLGISKDDLKDAWSQGKSFPEIAKEHGISEEDLHKKMKESFQARMQDKLKVLVEKGVITQQQADDRLQSMQNHPDKPSRMGHKFEHPWHK